MQAAVDSEAHLLVLQTKSSVCAALLMCADLAYRLRNGQIRTRRRERDVLRIEQRQDPILQRAGLPRE